MLKIWGGGKKKKDVVAGCKRKKKKGKSMLKCAVCLKSHQNILETHGNGKQHCSNEWETKSIFKKCKKLSKKNKHTGNSCQNILDIENIATVMPNILGQHCKNQNPHQKPHGKPRPETRACGRCTLKNAKHPGH